MSTKIALVASVCFLSLQFACSASMSSLRSRASFDLNCDQTNLQIVDIDGRTKGVSGCGQQGTYVESCEPNMFGKSCTWVLNANNSRTATHESARDAG